MIWLAYLGLGVITGVLSGLLGLGGGVIVVPGLFLLLHAAGYPPSVTIHMAEACSLGVMIFTTLGAVLTHLRRETELFKPYVRFIAGTVIGVAVGVALAAHAPAFVLRIAFAAFLLVQSVRLFRQRTVESEGNALPSPAKANVVTLGIGGLSGLLGIGGGVLLVPFLLQRRFSVPQATGMSSLNSLVTGLAGTVAWLFIGAFKLHNQAHHAHFMHWPIVIVVGVAALISAPLGVKLAYKAPVALFKRGFAVLMVIIAVKMLW